MRKFGVAFALSLAIAATLLFLLSDRKSVV